MSQDTYVPFRAAEKPPPRPAVKPKPKLPPRQLPPTPDSNDGSTPKDVASTSNKSLTPSESDSQVTRIVINVQPTRPSRPSVEKSVAATKSAKKEFQLPPESKSPLLSNCNDAFPYNPPFILATSSAAQQAQETGDVPPQLPMRPNRSQPTASLAATNIPTCNAPVILAHSFPHNNLLPNPSEPVHVSESLRRDTNRLRANAPAPPTVSYSSSSRSSGDVSDTYVPALSRNDFDYRPPVLRRHLRDYDSDDDSDEDISKEYVAPKSADAVDCAYLPCSPAPGPRQPNYSSSDGEVTDSTVVLESERTFALNFCELESKYFDELSVMMSLVDIIMEKESVGNFCKDSAEFAGFFKTIKGKLESLKLAIEGMQDLASDLREKLEAAIREWNPSLGPLKFMHIYKTRGKVLWLYPTFWFGAIEAVVRDLRKQKNSSDARLQNLYETIREKTGKECYELLDIPAKHLCNYRSRLETYVDFLEELPQVLAHAGSEELLNAISALDMVTDIIESDDQLTQNEALSKLSELLINSALPISTWLGPRKKFLKHSEFRSAGRRYLAYLFNDALLMLSIASDKKGEKVDTIDEISKWTITNCHSATFELTSSSPKKTFVLTAMSEEECQDWVYSLKHMEQCQDESTLQFRFDKIVNAMWVPDEARTQCKECKRLFTAANRRHHCRHCGEIFCAKCTPTAVWIKYRNQKQRSRTCYVCYEKYKDLTQASLLPCDQPEDIALSSSCVNLNIVSNSATLFTRSTSITNISGRLEGVTNVEFYVPMPRKHSKREKTRHSKWQAGKISLSSGMLRVFKENDVIMTIHLRDICPLKFPPPLALSERKIIIQRPSFRFDSEDKGNDEFMTSQTEDVIYLRWPDDNSYKLWKEAIEKERLNARM